MIVLESRWTDGGDRLSGVAPLEVEQVCSRVDAQGREVCPKV